MDLEGVEVFIEGESLGGILVGFFHGDDKIWGGAVAEVEKAKCTLTDRELGDEEGIFRDVFMTNKRG